MSQGLIAVAIIFGVVVLACLAAAMLYKSGGDDADEGGPFI